MLTHPKRPRKSLAGALFVLLALLAVLAGLRYCHSRLLVEYWANQLAAAPDDRIDECLAQVARLGEPGLELLVTALGSSRDRVSSAASQMLFEELARCELLPSDEACQRLAHIAALLAREAQSASPSHRFNPSPEVATAGLAAPTMHHYRAANLAARILAWPRADLAAVRPRLVADCELVLRAAIVERNSFRSSVEENGMNSVLPTHTHAPAEEAVSRRDDQSAAPAALAETNEVSQVATLPGRALPIDLHMGGTNALVPSPPRLLSVDTSDARPLAKARDENPSRLVLQDVASLGSSQASTVSIPTSVDPPIDDPVETRLEARLLFERLSSADADTVTRAQNELSRRGFSPLELDLGRRLTDPDPAVRRRWLEALPGLRGIDAKPWLLWLSRDVEADVRLAALALMATSNEAEMLRRVGQMAREDVDPRVQAQAARAVGGRRR